MRNKYFLYRTTFDFIGINYYFGGNWQFDPNAPNDFYASKIGTNLPTSDMGWEIQSEGLYHVLMELKKYNKPVYITENGIADAEDLQRKDFIRNHLKAVHRAIVDGIDIQGYLYWSLMDNFEWCHGYGPRFGLFEMDYNTQKRKARESAMWYAKVCKSNSLL